jgi:hypothetical protein
MDFFKIIATFLNLKRYKSNNDILSLQVLVKVKVKVLKSSENVPGFLMFNTLGNKKEQPKLLFPFNIKYYFLG